MVSFPGKHQVTRVNNKWDRALNWLQVAKIRSYLTLFSGQLAQKLHILAVFEVSGFQFFFLVKVLCIILPQYTEP